jgi:hypothetical protein
MDAPEARSRAILPESNINDGRPSVFPLSLAFFLFQNSNAVNTPGVLSVAQGRYGRNRKQE